MAQVARATARARRLARDRVALLVVLDAPHRRAQSRRPPGPGDRLPAAQPVPRRHHRGANAEPEDSGRHHRRRRRGVRRGPKPTPSPSIRKSCFSSRRPRTRRRPPSDDDSIEFSINPERVGPVLHRLVTPTHTRARIYDRDGLLLLDSQTLSARSALPGAEPEKTEAKSLAWWRRLWVEARQSFAPTKKQPRQRRLDNQRQVAVRSRRGAEGTARIGRSRRRGGRNDRLGQRADPAGGERSAARCCSRPKAATSIPSSPPSDGRCCGSSWFWRR